MASEYDFHLPYPPSVNAMWRTFRNRVILSKAGRDYRIAALNHLEGLGLTNEKVEGRLHVSMVIYPPTLRKYDIDNRCKAPFDALTHAGFWLDDEQVDSLNIKKGEKIKGGLIKLKVSVINSH